MISIITLFITFAIINATIGEQQIPVEVQTRLLNTEEESAAATAIATQAESVAAGGGAATGSNLILDAGLIGSIATIGGAMFAAYKRNTSRVDATADTSINLAQSLKATDKGTADIANNLATALQKLAGVNPEIGKALENCKEVAKENAEGWNKDIKQYYENKPLPKSEDLGLDKVKEKLKEVNHMTTSNSDDDD